MLATYYVSCTLLGTGKHTPYPQLIVTLNSVQEMHVMAEKGSERLTSLSRVTQLVNGEARI